jgi:hypothetical protein
MGKKISLVDGLLTSQWKSVGLSDLSLAATMTL